MVLEAALEGAALFVGGIAAVSLSYAACYAYHTVEKMDRSAVETKDVETHQSNGLPAAK